MRFYTNDAIDERMKGYIKDGSLDSIKQTKYGYVNVAVLNYFYDPIETHTYHEVIKGLKVGDIIPINVNYHNGDKIERKTINVRVGALISEPIETHTYHEVIKGLKVGDIIPINVNYHNGDKIERKTINVRVGALISESWLGYGDHEVIKGLKVGDIIPINVNYHNGDKIERKTINVRVGALISESWLGYGDQLLPSRVELITSDSNMKAIFGRETFNKIGINLKDSNTDAENKKVIDYVEDNIPARISNRFNFEKEQRMAELEMRKEAIISLILIVLISILNLYLF